MNCTKKNIIAILYEHNYHYQQHLKSRVLKCIIYFLGGGGIWLDHSGFEPLKSNSSIHIPQILWFPNQYCQEVCIHLMQVASLCSGGEKLKNSMYPSTKANQHGQLQRWQKVEKGGNTSNKWVS